MAQKTARGSKRKEITIEKAAALYLKTTHISGVGETTKRILDAVRELTNNSLLPMKQLMGKIREWVENGWAIITNKYVRLTSLGAFRLENLARSAAAA